MKGSNDGLSPADQVSFRNTKFISLIPLAPAAATELNNQPVHVKRLTYFSRRLKACAFDLQKV